MKIIKQNVAKPRKSPNTQKRRNKIIFFTLAAVLLLGIGFVGWRLLETRDLYASSGGYSIDIHEFRRTKDAYERYYQTVEGGSEPDDLDEMVLRELFALQVIESEAEKLEVVIDKKAIDDELVYLTENFLPGDVEMPETREAKIEAAIDQYDKSRGWTRDDVYHMEKLRLLRQAVSHTLRIRNVVAVYGYYDDSDEPGSVVSEFETKVRPVLEQDNDMSETVDRLNQLNNQLDDSSLTGIEAYNLSALRARDVEDRLDKSLVQFFDELQEVGAVSSVYDEGGLLSMFRLEGITEGEYDSWDAEGYKLAEKATVYGIGIGWDRVLTAAGLKS